MPVIRASAIFFAIALLVTAPAPAQTVATTPPLSGGHAGVATDGEIPDTTKHWYDTLEVERPRFARATLGERMALAAFTALALPVGLSVGATTIVPPVINVLRERGHSYIGITSGTGIGFGGDTTQLKYYPDLRAQLELGYYFDRERPFVIHVGMLKDLIVGNTGARSHFSFGVSGGLGVMTDVHSYQPYLEAWVGLLNPLGIQFVPLFPMHNYGVRARAGFNPTSATVWYEIGVGMTSTFKR